MNDLEAMQIAIAAADRARLVSRPNPWVGAVVVTQAGKIFEGSTSRVGGPHAEIMAIRAAAKLAIGATLYTTLEPCDHTGRTGPCTQAIIDARIKRVVIGIVDPDEKVSGRGISRLREAGITVEVGVLADEISSQLKSYIHHRKTKRPFVILKMATTLDGRTAAPDGTSMWITGETARNRVQQLRAQSDAVLVGAGTVRKDDPKLTVRDVDGDSPRRIVLGEVSPKARVNPCTQWRGSLIDLLDELGSQDVLQLLIEGGPTVAASFHREGLINQYIIHLAPAFSGGNDGLGVFEGRGIATMADLWRGCITSSQQLGDDLEIIIEPITQAQETTR
ncbi:MAG: bifunctional diaminohydroxyphosphoribosylaminopyrimidine deaminase/5-amino-6-(5-phosphoribosylamino)uracil reductase RibD [Actinomycetota bacterium]|nr:bifunctional diaminohydroxyphosphoribosylaminopyrimidine deaminase/5-amino-6-(5-phosphoribosylamino)uracil reductase RibD [Actinomycetota bacterium]